MSFQFSYIQADNPQDDNDLRTRLVPPMWIHQGPASTAADLNLDQGVLNMIMYLRNIVQQTKK